MKVEPTEIPLGSGYYVSESLPVSHQLCQNFVPNYPQTSAASGSQLFTRLGLNQIDTTGIGNPNRGLRIMAGIPYYVNGNTLWRLTRTITALNVEVFGLDILGTIPGMGRVGMADSGTQLVIIVPGTSDAYVYSDAGGFSKITDPEFIPSPATVVNSVVFSAGFFVFSADQAFVFESDPNDALSYDSFNSFIYGNARNNVVGLHEFKEQLYVFSTTDSAVYVPTNIELGSIGSAFVKSEGYEFSKGLSSADSIFDFGSTFVMMGQGFNETPKIYIYTGNDFDPISDTSVEFILEGYTFDELADSFGYNYTHRGETFAVFNMKNNTLKYCLKASQLSGELIWVEDRSTGLANKDRFRVNSIGTAYDRLLVGDSEDGIIGELTEDSFDDYGKLIRYLVSLPPISGSNKKLFHRFLRLEVESGVATEGDELVIEMRYSDNGKTFTPYRPQDCGLVGEYDTILEWEDLGETRTPRTYEFRATKPGKYVLIRCWVGLDGN